MVGILFAILILLAMAVKQVGFFYKNDFPYLKGENTVIIAPKNGNEEAIVLPIEKVLFEYIEIIDSCGPNFNGECLNVRSGPGEDYPKVMRLRNGIVLKIGGKV